MNMFLHELNAYRKSTVIWTISLAVIVILFLVMFPAFSSNAEELKKLLESLPLALRNAIGLSLDNIGSLLGFYSTLTFLYITLCGAIQAMNLGTSIVSKEVREKTADFLLTKPVSRVQIMTAKLLAALASLAITNAIYIVVASITASIVTSQAFSMKIFLLISATLYFIQLMFLALGVVVSVVAPKIKSVLPVSLGTVFAFFFISMFGSAIGDDNLRYITPFKFYDPAYIIQNASYETSFIILEVGLITLAIVASYIIYVKKDIDSV
ncbi:ABC transporter permease [Desulfosporosinus fructosivorans]|uniref:ABC transporter permease n=1 Tax=Desulfosporosinus fructosivorans TaxID=2018669 RepID=A0A4Z0RA79_9FIRM|nr:ABC transporter permease subunit [Desulfosporosinus fructosivorans]TGE38536.1 ABC transporter permease [Desulfosporosinus fructosivorans]